MRETQFRIWANKVLKEYLVKGYAINKQGAKGINGRIIKEATVRNFRTVRK